MQVPEINVEELDRRWSADVTVLDVRQPDEYLEAHVPGAVLIPLDQLAERLADVPAAPLAVICRSGARSLAATEFLLANGREAVNVAGGTLAWIESGRPCATGPGAG